VRASVFAPAEYQPQRLSDLFCRHKISHQAFMAALARLALATLYPAGLPARLFWIADSTHTEKPYAERVASSSPTSISMGKSRCGRACSVVHSSMSRGAPCRS
jgi:hypothetical protein